MKFGIGAIFRDEFDYILEWLAWHRLAGFPEFFIADNGSVDGTRQLLEALAEAGLIKFFYVPLQKGSQQLAYKQIQKKYGHLADAIAFIDADEFIYSDDGKKPVEYLEQFFSNPAVGAVGINWRIFGSSGEIDQKQGLVIERFLHCASNDNRGNRHIKSIVRPQFIENLKSVHHFSLSNDFCYLDGEGKKIVFIDRVTHQPIENFSPFSELVESPLRINHYVIKSLQEFTEKKRKRGDATKDPNHDRGHQFFINHDLNDVEFLSASLLADEVRKEIRKIKLRLRATTLFYKKGKAAINFKTTHIGGWAVFDTEKAKIMIFVNGSLQAEVGAFRYRPDVIKAGLSKDGYCGFHYVFDPPLKSGDTVHISIYANPFKFKTNTFNIE
jgi:glycosyltransferase involved in cell wall biosynthesis